MRTKKAQLTNVYSIRIKFVRKLIINKYLPTPRPPVLIVLPPSWCLWPLTRRGCSCSCVVSLGFLAWYLFPFFYMLQTVIDAYPKTTFFYTPFHRLARRKAFFLQISVCRFMFCWTSRVCIARIVRQRYL